MSNFNSINEVKQMFTVERELAMQITEHTYNGKPGTGYQYFRKPEDIISKYDNSKTVLFLAAEFSVGDSNFLAGPFKHNTKHYGLVSVSYLDNAPTEAEFTSKFVKENFKPDSCSGMPFAARKRVTDYFDGKSEFWYDQVSKQSFSCIDLKFGKHEIDPAVLSRLTKEGTCAVFFMTEAAREIVLGLMNSNEIEEWYATLAQARDCGLKESLATTAFSEKPYVLHLQGTDDASWAKNFSSLDEVVSFIERMRKEGSNVVAEMEFTN